MTPKTIKDLLEAIDKAGEAQRALIERQDGLTLSDIDALNTIGLSLRKIRQKVQIEAKKINKPKP